MEKIPKDQKTEAPGDRLSDLPDATICHILSFLPTKISVSMSILAKRWIPLWKLVPCLCFDNKDHLAGETSFSAMISEVLNLRGPERIDSFCMNLSFVGNRSCNKYDFVEWISTVINRDVRQLKLYISCFYELHLPANLFTCQTLVELSIDTGGLNGTIPISWTSGNLPSLPALKKLRLHGVNYLPDCSLLQLLGGCPVLDELSVAHNMIHCCISSLTLTRVIMDNEYFQIVKGGGIVELEIPGLIFIGFNEYREEPLIIVSEALTSVSEADVAYHLMSTSTAYFESVTKFVGQLSNVKSLRLFTYEMRVLDSAFSEFTTMFRNLTKLKLDADCRFVTTFLENADNLEELHITMGKHVWMEPQQVPACMVFNLHIVKIDDFKAEEAADYNIIRYTLLNAILLKTMIINFDRGIGLERENEALKKIASFSRRTKACLTFN